MLFALRLVFLWVFGEPGSSAEELARALYLGLKFDLRLAVLASLPLGLSPGVSRA